MRRVLALAMMLLTVLAVASSALGTSWGPPTTAASPFRFEIYKQAYLEDFSGARFLSVISEEESYLYPDANITYIIKVFVPPVQEINNFYGLDFNAGDKIKLTITFTYTNVSTGEARKDSTIVLSNTEQELKFTDTSKGAEWTAKIAIKAGLEDILIDGAWRVAKKSFSGIRPCAKCKPENLRGFMFTGDCASYSIFVSTNTKGKVLDIYVVDPCSSDEEYAGELRELGAELYGWCAVGVENAYAPGLCAENTEYPTSCGMLRFARRQIPYGSYISADYKTWVPQWSGYLGDLNTYENFKEWCERKGNNPAMYNKLYYRTETGSTAEIKGTEDFLIKDGPGGYDFTDIGGVYSDVQINSIDPLSKTGAPREFPDFQTTLYPYDPGTVVPSAFYLKYGHIYAPTEPYKDAKLYRMRSAFSVECETNESAYLNAANHMLGLLQFTYADVVAGEVYMTEDILLTNFSLDTQLN